MKENKIIGCFVIISIIISVSISLAIPQINYGLDKNWKAQAYEQNGADIKVEMNFDSIKFNETLEKLDEIENIEEIFEFAGSIEKENKQTFSDILLGEYNLNSDEIILSNNVAKVLNVSVGDNVEVFGEKYKVKDIESKVKAVGQQGEQMGYVKVSGVNFDTTKAYGKLILINANNIEEVVKELKKVEDKFTYTTVQDIEQQIEAKVSSNTMALSILNTMCIIMTIISLISSIFLIITKSNKEIAIMKITGIEYKKIKKAFQLQFYCYSIPAVLLGSILSMYLTKIILKMDYIIYKVDKINIKQMIIGAILFIIMYMIYIIIGTGLIKNIDPLTVIKVSKEKVKIKKTLILSLLFTIISLIAYSNYVGSVNVISGSFIIIALITIFFIISYILLSLLILLRPKKVMRKYCILHIKQKRNPIILTILSLSFTILFFLIGFTLSKTIGHSFDKGLQSKIEYNYMITTSDPNSIESKLLQDDETGKYTKLYRKNGVLYYNEKVDSSVNLCGIDSNEFGVKFKILEGKDLLEGDKEGVLITSKLANDLKLGVNDEINIIVKNINYKYKIKGIYEADTINPGDILIQKEALQGEADNILYLANIKSSDVADKLTNVGIVAVQNIGNSLEQSMNNMLKIFKLLCFICIFSSIIFNINIIYINSIEYFRNFVIVRALSIAKWELYKQILTEMIIILFITIIMSLGIYFWILKLAMGIMFGASVELTTKMIIPPILISLIIISIIFLIPVNFINKSSSFEELKELD